MLIILRKKLFTNKSNCSMKLNHFSGGSFLRFYFIKMSASALKISFWGGGHYYS